MQKLQGYLVASNWLASVKFVTEPVVLYFPEWKKELGNINVILRINNRNHNYIFVIR